MSEFAAIEKSGNSRLPQQNTKGSFISAEFIYCKCGCSSLNNEYFLYSILGRQQVISYISSCLIDLKVLHPHRKGHSDLPFTGNIGCTVSCQNNHQSHCRLSASRYLRALNAFENTQSLSQLMFSAFLTASGHYKNHLFYYYK